jgi:hypothetical protein
MSRLIVLLDWLGCFLLSRLPDKVLYWAVFVAANRTINDLYPETEIAELTFLQILRRLQYGADRQSE